MSEPERAYAHNRFYLWVTKGRPEGLFDSAFLRKVAAGDYGPDVRNEYEKAGLLAGKNAAGGNTHVLVFVAVAAVAAYVLLKR